MSATNSTPIINLPLFIGTDKPAWLTDWNGAMNTIDTAIASLQTAEAGTATSLASLPPNGNRLSGSCYSWAPHSSWFTKVWTRALSGFPPF